MFCTKKINFNNIYNIVEISDIQSNTGAVTRALIAANPPVKLLITVLTRARANTNKRHAKRAREDPSLVIPHFDPKAPVHPIIVKVYHNVHTVYIHNLSESASYRAAVVMSRTLRSLMGWRVRCLCVCRCSLAYRSALARAVRLIVCPSF